MNETTQEEYSNMFNNANIFCNKDINQKMLTINDLENIEFEKQVIHKSTPSELFQLIKNQPIKYLSIIEHFKDLHQIVLDKGFCINRNKITNNLEIDIKFITDSKYTKIGYNYDVAVNDSQIIDDLLIVIKSKSKISESLLTNKSIMTKHQHNKIHKSNDIDRILFNIINSKLDTIIDQNQKLYDIITNLKLSV